MQTQQRNEWFSNFWEAHEKLKFRKPSMINYGCFSAGKIGEDNDRDERCLSASKDEFMRMLHASIALELVEDNLLSYKELFTNLNYKGLLINNKGKSVSYISVKKYAMQIKEILRENQGIVFLKTSRPRTYTRQVLILLERGYTLEEVAEKTNNTIDYCYKVRAQERYKQKKLKKEGKI